MKAAPWTTVLLKAHRRYSDSELVVVPEAGHHIHLDAPQAVIEAIGKVKVKVAVRKK